MAATAAAWYDPDGVAFAEDADPQPTTTRARRVRGLAQGPAAMDSRALVGAIPNAALVVAHDGRIVAANRAADELFCRPVTDFQVEDLIPEALRPAHASLRRSSVSTGHSRAMGSGIVVAAARADGTTFPAEVSISPVDTDEGPATLAIIVDTSRSVERLATLEHQATHDPLTGLGNRVALHAFLADVFSLPAADRPVSVLAIDLDGLRDANRRLGHAGGDALLRGYAHRLVSLVRPVDFVARIGGDEFVVVCEGSTETSRVIAARLVGPHEERRGTRGGAPVLVTASIGLAARRGREGASTLLRRADDALLEAKLAGRCRVVEAR
jgi:diguanylate cyclase (GGDEF)-like protein/PAS domain S-box-containing protein